MDFHYLIVVSTGEGYVVHRLIATQDRVAIYAPIGAEWDSIESAVRFGDSIAEKEL